MPDSWEECAAQGMTMTEAARHLGRSPSAAKQYSNRHGLKFIRGWERKTEAPPQPQAKPTQPAMPPHPFWTPERDAVVFEADGSYQRLRSAAEMLGKPYSCCLARWHLLRAAI